MAAMAVGSAWSAPVATSPCDVSCYKNPTDTRILRVAAADLVTRPELQERVDEWRSGGGLVILDLRKNPHAIDDGALLRQRPPFARFLRHSKRQAAQIELHRAQG